MQKLLTSLAAASALALLASAAQACDWHNNVNASAEQSQQSVAMSTHDGMTVTPPVADDAAPTEVVATPTCPADDEDCAKASE